MAPPLLNLDAIRLTFGGTPLLTSAELQVGESDDCGRMARRVPAPGSYGLDLAKWTQGVRPGLAVAGAALHVDAGAHVVARRNIGQKFPGAVTRLRSIPEVMVSVQNGDSGIERLFGRAPQPILADRGMDLRGCRGHRSSPARSPRFAWRSACVTFVLPCRNRAEARMRLVWQR